MPFYESVVELRRILTWTFKKTKMSKLIAVVEDEPDIARLLSIQLNKAGFKVMIFLNAESFLRFLNEKIPDLLILDLMLPDADGLEICKFLKNNETLSAIPIIILTAKSEEVDKVLGLELGADDYVTKPFSVKEVIARVKAVLRRKEGQHHFAGKIQIGDLLEIDPKKYETFVEGKKVSLTTTEFKILRLLSSRKGWVFSRYEILDYLWEGEKIVSDRTVDVHVKNLRDKLGKAAKFIKCVRGVGYKLEE